jgi:RNA polymerase sigma-70 factor, ECF subfamily
LSGGFLAAAPEVIVDRNLVERAQRGDRDAFAQLATIASDRLFATALRILRDFDAAGDALQMALVHIWRDLPTLRDPERFEAWSYRLIVRQCHAELRRARRRPRAADLMSTDAAIGDAQLSVSLRDELDRAFERLSTDHRAVLVLMYYGDHTIPEIAESLGISEGTVKSRLHYARSAMRAALDADARPVSQEGRLA